MAVQRPETAEGPSDVPSAQPWTIPFSDRASATDILHCFRLLLGRMPNREEWTGHSSRAGEALDQVVASYVGSLEFSRRGLLHGTSLGQVSLAKLSRFCIHTQADDAAVGRHVADDNYEPDVTALFVATLKPGDAVLDLGANIGWFTMLSASLVGPTGAVVAVEPNPSNARLIEASRRANGYETVRVVQVAAGSSAGLLVLHRAHSNGTTSAPPDGIAALLDAETVGCVRAETLVPDGLRIALIKVDVEGAEYLALGGCTGLIARDRPRIVSEFSPGLMPGISGISGPGYLDWLVGLGYRLGIVQGDGSVRPANPDEIMAEHAARGLDHLDLFCEPLPAAVAAPERPGLAARVGRGLPSPLRVPLRALVRAGYRLRHRAPALLLVGLAGLGLAACAPRSCANPDVLDFVDASDRQADLAHVGLVRDAVRSAPGPRPDLLRCSVWERRRPPGSRQTVLVPQYFGLQYVNRGWKVFP